MLNQMLILAYMGLVLQNIIDVKLLWRHLWKVEKQESCDTMMFGEKNREIVYVWGKEQYGGEQYESNTVWALIL